MLKVIITRVILFLILIVRFTRQDEHGDLIKVISDFFIRRHVQTITAATCWPKDVNGELLKTFSTIDKSLSFRLFSPQTYATWYRYGFIVDLSCDGTLNFMHQASNDRLFNLQNDWLLFNQKSISNTNDTLTIASVVFETYLGKSYVLPDSGVFLFQEIGKNNWEIWSGFRASKLDTIQVFKTGLASKYHIEIYDSIELRTNFRGVNLKATTVIFNPSEFVGFNMTTTTTGLDVYAYMHYPMIQVLADQLNFKFTVSITDDHGWAYDNGSFFGLIGILQREESDFGAAGSLMRLDRMTAVDFTVGTVTLESNILFKQPMLSSITNIHIKPFKYEVWQITLIMLIGFVLILLFLNKFKANRGSTVTVLDIIGLVHGAICQQGYTIVLILNSIKIVVFVLFLTTFFLFNAYSASIVSLFQSTSSSIINVKDFLHTKSMTMSIQIATYAKPYFNETTNEILRKLYDVKIKPNDENHSFTDASKGIERIRTEFHGFMVEKTSAYRIINKEWREEEKCGLYEIQLFRLPVLAIPVVKKSGHKDVFKQKLIQQHEVGIRQRFTQRWIPHKPTCDSAKRNRKYVSISINEILPTITLFGYGMLISLTVFVLELAYHSLMNYVNIKFAKEDKTTKMKINGKSLYPIGDQKYAK